MIYFIQSCRSALAFILRVKPMYILERKSTHLPHVPDHLKKISAGLEPVWPNDYIIFSIFGHLQQFKFVQYH